MHINFNASVEDAFSWKSNNNVTTPPSHTWLLSCTNPVTLSIPTFHWSWIWKLKLWEKLKFLFWLACYNSVPTLLSLNHRNLDPSAICSRCGIEEESFLHCDCIYSKNIWLLLSFTDPNFFSSMVVSEWLKVVRLVSIPSLTLLVYGGLGVTVIKYVFPMRFGLIIGSLTAMVEWVAEIKKVNVEYKFYEMWAIFIFKIIGLTVYPTRLKSWYIGIL